MIVAALSSADCMPVAYAERHAEIGARLGLDFTEIIKAIDHIPLCLRGDDHRQSRRRIAQVMAASEQRCAAVLAEDVPALVADLMREGPHDVMEEFVLPCVNRAISAVTGIDIDHDANSLVSKVFSQTMGVSKRKRLNATFRDLKAQIAARRPDLHEAEIHDLVALNILGTDALRGTLGLSLHAHFAGGEVAGTCPSRTAVAYIDREVVAPTQLADQSFDPGTILRLRLEAFTDTEDPGDRLRFFGAGAHLCLGRKFSVALWSGIVSELARYPREITVTAFSLKRDDVFQLPETFQIEVRHV